MLSDMLTRHLVTMFLIFLFSIIALNRKSSRIRNKGISG